MDVPFVGPSDTDRSVNMNCMRTLNFYLELDQFGKRPICLYGTPGLDLKVTDAAASVVRGMWNVNNSLYVVCGNKLRKYNTNFSPTTIGTLNTSTGQVSMSNNTTQLIVVDGGDGYLVTISGDVFSTISSPGFPAAPTQVTFLNEYFIVNDAGTQKFYFSSAADGSTWDALDFASAEGSYDDLVALIADHKELWLFGSNSIEVWTGSTSNPDAPFELISGAFIEQGVAATFSVAKMDNSLFWLGTNDRGRGIVWRAEGYVPKRISTHAVEFAIQRYTTISDAVAYAYQQDGHSFYVLTFPTEDKTWVYDAATNLWHERCWRDPSLGEEHRHRSNCHVFFNGEHIVGDWEDGRIYELDPDTYDDDGDEILSIRASGHIYDKEEQRTMFHHRLQVDIESGVGLSTGQGSDPQIMLRWSNDGGHTWSGYHYADVGSFAAIGAVGEYRRRAIWNRLGRARDRVYEISITDPVKRVILGANLRTTMGTS